MYGVFGDYAYTAGLKSDQNGVEISLQNYITKTLILLKSDQNGVEMSLCTEHTLAKTH